MVCVCGERAGLQVVSEEFDPAEDGQQLPVKGTVLGLRWRELPGEKRDGPP